MALKEYKIKVIDANNKPLLNFPMATQYVGGDKKNNKLTDDIDGILTFQSDGRAVEIFVLTPIDKNGLPDMTKFKEDNDNDNAYYKITTINVSRNLPPTIKSPYFLTDYGIAKTKFIFYENEQDKKIYSVPLTVKVSYLVGEAKTSPRFIEAIQEVKNGELNITSILHSRIQVHPYKPDNSPFTTSQGYIPRSTTPINLPVYFDIRSSKAITTPDEPNLPVIVPEVGVVKCLTCDKSLKIDIEFIKSVAPKAKKDFQQALLLLPNYLKKYSSNTCRDLINILAQGQIETLDFTAVRESLNYTKKTFKTPENIYSISPTAMNAGFVRRGMGKYTKQQKLDYIWKHLADNDKAYGFHLYGNESYPNNDYRGRGILHLTHFAGYKDCADGTGLDVVKNPSLLEKNYNIAIETGTWFWKNKNNGAILKLTASESIQINSDSVTTAITSLVNGGSMKLAERKAAKKSIAKKFIEKYGVCK